MRRRATLVTGHQFGKPLARLVQLPGRLKGFDLDGHPGICFPADQRRGRS